MLKRDKDRYFLKAVELISALSNIDQQKQLVSMTGLSKGMVSLVLNLKNAGNDETKTKIACAYGYSFDDFIDVGRMEIEDGPEKPKNKERIVKNIGIRFGHSAARDTITPCLEPPVDYIGEKKGGDIIADQKQWDALWALLNEERDELKRKREEVEILKDRIRELEEALHSQNIPITKKNGTEIK